MISYEQCKTHGQLPQALAHVGKMPVGFIGRQPTARKSKIFELALRIYKHKNGLRGRASSEVCAEGDSDEK